MSRVSMVLAALMIGLATPVWAQQISEQEASQAAKGVVEAFDKALREKDAARIGALFTEDATRVLAEGPQVGRAEIEKAFTGLFKVYTPELDKIEKVALIGKDVIGSVNKLAGTYSGPKGPEALKGYATFVYVRDGNEWKIRMEVVSLE